MSRPPILPMLDALERTLAQGDVPNARLIAAEIRAAIERPPEYLDSAELPVPVPEPDEIDESEPDTLRIRPPFKERGPKPDPDR